MFPYLLAVNYNINSIKKRDIKLNDSQRQPLSQSIE